MVIDQYRQQLFKKILKNKLSNTFQNFIIVQLQFNNKAIILCMLFFHKNFQMHV